jgi:hypothetical protein
MLRCLCLIALLVPAGCSPPPQAPTEFDDLCAFIFAHRDDSDLETLQLAVDNLQAWLKSNRESVEEGYVVQNIDPKVVEEMEGKPFDLTHLLGVAHATEYDASLEQMFDIILDPNEEASIDEEGRTTKKRTYLTDRDCFVAGTCNRLEYTNEAINDYPLTLEATVHYKSILRRIQTTEGPTIVAWNFFIEPSRFNFDWLSVDLTYYLGVSVEKEDKRVERTQATWILANMGDGPVPVDVGLSLALDEVKNGATWLKGEIFNRYGQGPDPSAE